MTSYNRRLATFSKCSPELKLSPFVLARKGFSYDKKSFMVICDDCLVSFNIAGEVGHRADCPNFEENDTQTQNMSTNTFLSMPTMDLQLACVSQTILEQNPWQSEWFSASRTADDSEDRSNQMHEITTYSSGEASVVLEDNESRELTSDWTCKICLDIEVSVVFLPCGHLVSCVQCATRLRICPICRTRILKTITARMA